MIIYHGSEQVIHKQNPEADIVPTFKSLRMQHRETGPQSVIPALFLLPCILSYSLAASSTAISYQTKNSQEPKFLRVMC